MFEMHLKIPKFDVALIVIWYCVSQLMSKLVLLIIVCIIEFHCLKVGNLLF